MRNNMPITNNEYSLTDKDLIVSKTDLQGNITYINDDFLRISGFSEAELMGQPQNIVRHPDMPEQAFADLWRDLKAGIAWTGFIKNRCKNGDFYWVKANVTPVNDGEKVTGYMSVRELATREEIEQISHHYHLFKQGQQETRQIRHGAVITPSWKNKLSIFKNMNFKQRLTALFSLVVAMLALSLVLGFSLNYHNNHTLSMLYSEHIDTLQRGHTLQQQLQPLQQSNIINQRLNAEQISILQGLTLANEESFAHKIAQATSAYDAQKRHYVEMSIYMLAAILIVFLISIITLRKFSLLLLLPAQRARGYLRELSQGNYSFQVEIDCKDELSDVLQYLKMMQIKLGFEVEDMKRKANETTRIKIALDSASTNVMITDPNRHIIYANTAIVDMFKKVERDIASVLPSFDADHLLGSNINQFYEGDAKHNPFVNTLDSEIRKEMLIAGHTFLLVINPVLNEQGQRLGTVIEWNDRTAQIAVEKEVENVVIGAAQGDFTQRMTLEDKDAFFTRLSQAINNLMEISESGLNEVVRMLSALSKGDLTYRIDNDYQGTFGQLKDDSNLTADKLQEIVLQIQQATDTINSASKEIALGNSDLSQRTEEQASSLQQTASSIEELTATVQQNADSAEQANNLAHGASEIARKGGNVVGKVVQTMTGINDSSREIVDIISVIDGIAFQTNILALNAAVEAARAGEQGRGFAVVASEVRSLAQRSATAAKEIKTLIGDSVIKVESGAKLVDEAGNTMTEIVDAVKRVTDIIAEIAIASHQQSSGIIQVSQAVSQMDDATQQNAALVEEASASAESLEEQAVNLSNTVSMFNTGQTFQVEQDLTVKNAPVYRGTDKRREDDEWLQF